MDRIKGVKRLTENRFLNLYELDARQRDGKAIRYYVASRAKGTEDLKSVSGHRRADGVIMYGVYAWGVMMNYKLQVTNYKFGVVHESSPCWRFALKF